MLQPVPLLYHHARLPWIEDRIAVRVDEPDAAVGAIAQIRQAEPNHSLHVEDGLAYVVALLVLKDDCDSFISRFNKCFVESIEQYGKSVGEKDYFWKKIRPTYPGLFTALHRIKLYRNDHLHLRLNQKVAQETVEFLKTDLEGRKPTQVEDLDFVLQQCVMDGLLLGIHIEVDKLN